MNTRPTLKPLLLLAVCAAIVGLLAAATPASTEPPAPYLEAADCPFPFPSDLQVSCGKLVVPENRLAPESRLIRLPYAIIHSTASHPQPDPILYTSSGGPGGGAFGAWKHLSYNFDFLKSRDLILLEQRGTRWAEPYLACPELNQAMFANLTQVRARDEEIALEVEAALHCRDTLRSQGVDLDGYTTLQSAADVEDLRVLLGIRQWNMIGTSYAARIVLTVMRLYPDSLRSIVLDSVYDPSVAFIEQRVPAYAGALERLFVQCASDAACSSAFPDLREHFLAVLARANEEPLRAEIHHPRTGQPVTLQLTGDDLALGVFNAVRDARLLPYLPFLIEEVYAGNLDVITPVAQNGFSSMFNNPLGMYYAAECAEEYPFNDLDRQRQAAAQYPGLEHFLPTPSDPFICAAWGAEPVTADFRQPVVEGVPALVLSGALDAVIAPAVSSAAAARLPEAVYLNVPGLTHAVMDVDVCSRQIAAAFIELPGPEVIGLCAPGLEQLDFITPADLVVTPLPYWLTANLIFPSPGVAVALGIGLGLVALIGLFLILRHVKQSGWSLWTAFAGLATTLLLALEISFIGMLFTSDRILLGFGMPAAYGWRLTLSWFLILIALVGSLLLASRRFEKLWPGK